MDTILIRSSQMHRKTDTHDLVMLALSVGLTAGPIASEGAGTAQGELVWTHKEVMTAVWGG
jgi:hypothetical protein